MENPNCLPDKRSSPEQMHTRLSNRIHTFKDFMEKLLECNLKDVKALCDLKMRTVQRQIMAEELRLKASEVEDRNDPVLKSRFDEVEYFAGQLNFVKGRFDEYRRLITQSKAKSEVLKKENEALNAKLRGIQRENLRNCIHKAEAKNELTTTKATNSFMSPCLSSISLNSMKPSNTVKKQLLQLKNVKRIQRIKQFDVNDRYRSTGDFFDQCCRAYVKKLNMTEGVKCKLKQAVLPMVNSKVPPNNEVFRYKRKMNHVI